MQLSISKLPKLRIFLLKMLKFFHCCVQMVGRESPDLVNSSIIIPTLKYIKFPTKLTEFKWSARPEGDQSQHDFFDLFNHAQGIVQNKSLCDLILMEI